MWVLGDFTLAVIHIVAQLGDMRFNARVNCFIGLLLFAFKLPAADLPAPMMDGAWSIGSEFLNPDPLQFVSQVSREQLGRTPAWNPANEFPPLSPQKAEAQAQAMLKRVLGDRRWTRPEITLKPFDVATDAGDRREVRWIYVLHFGLLGDTDSEGGSFNIIVLMDGTAVSPKPVVPKPVTPKPPATNAPPAKSTVPAKPAGT